MWIDLICAFGGSRPPSKLSIRSTASGPAMSWSCRAISSGSSESASICSRVIAVPNVDVRSAAACCASRPTVTESVILRSGRTSTCLFSPALIRMSFSRPRSKPGNSPVIEYRPGGSASNVARPLSVVLTGAVDVAFVAASSPTMVTLAFGITAPLGSTTVTITLAVSVRVCARTGDATSRARSAAPAANLTNPPNLANPPNPVISPPQISSDRS